MLHFGDALGEFTLCGEKLLKPLPRTSTGPLCWECIDVLAKFMRGE